MLMDLLIWWVQQMRELLPKSLVMRSRYANALVAQVGATGMSVAARRGGTERVLGHLEPGGAVQRRFASRRGEPTILVLPPDMALEQSATLPLASERNVAAVLRYEMDRFTPFQAEDLFWTWRVERRDRANGLLNLRLLLVPKAAIQSALATMEAAGLRPAALETATSSGTQYLPLSGPDGGDGRHRSAVLASWTCAVLAIAACTVPVIRQERAIGQAEARVEALRPRVAVVEALRRRIAADTSGSDLFSAETAKIGNPLRALAAVTAALPDDTYLTSFAMRDRKISLAGRSAGAARLIATLSADPELRDPAFDAPVTRGGDRVDLFSIQLGLAP